MPQYASVQKPPHNQQPDQFLARIQQSTHCRNCKFLLKFKFSFKIIIKTACVYSKWTSPIIS